MKKVLSMLFLALISTFTFCACSNDEDEVGLNDPNYIIGTWEMANSPEEVFEFHKDGTATWYTHNGIEMRFTYTYASAGPGYGFIKMTITGYYDNGVLFHEPSVEEQENTQRNIRVMLLKGGVVFVIDDDSGHEMTKIK